nr:cyclophilin-like fold protein [Fredinandcohnia onubensis]
MRRKRIFYMLLLCVIFVVLSGCSNTRPNDTNNSESNSNSELSSDSLNNNQTDNEVAKDNSMGETDNSSISESNEREGNDTMSSMTITVGDKKFTITLYDNPTTRALVKELPMTIKMDDLNGNEKLYYFSHSLPTNSERVGSIKAGDLNLYGSDCFVLFYESFSTPYSYTRLGYTEDATGLANALGRGSVTVTFELDN